MDSEQLIFSSDKERTYQTGKNNLGREIKCHSPLLVYFSAAATWQKYYASVVT